MVYCSSSPDDSEAMLALQRRAGGGRQPSCTKYPVCRGKLYYRLGSCDFGHLVEPDGDLGTRRARPGPSRLHRPEARRHVGQLQARPRTVFSPPDGQAAPLLLLTELRQVARRTVRRMSSPGARVLLPAGTSLRSTLPTAPSSPASAHPRANSFPQSTVTVKHMPLAAALADFPRLQAQNKRTRPPLRPSIRQAAATASR